MEKGVLYLVATPIGNLSDISRRAIDVLSSADAVAAEDTRHTVNLLNSLGVKNTLISFHEHSKKDKFEKLIALLMDGKDLAVVSDAGTPLVSDPGAELVQMAAERGIRVVPIPGACAPISALIVSGLYNGRFVFEGFLPRDGADRKKALRAIRDEERTVVLLESPYRLKSTLAQFAEEFGGERRVAVCRELTKIYEEVIRGRLGEVAEMFAEREVKGEIVVVLEGVVKQEEEISDGAIREKLEEHIRNGRTKKEAVGLTAESFHIPKNRVYKIMIDH
jgi:16S rRNA (cytidine1402-2'-O)-methyltransferase